jgi:hypothetical protein
MGDPAAPDPSPYLKLQLALVRFWRALGDAIDPRHSRNAWWRRVIGGWCRQLAHDWEAAAKDRAFSEQWTGQHGWYLDQLQQGATGTRRPDPFRTQEGPHDHEFGAGHD